jgi:hypothetical protein
MMQMSGRRRVRGSWLLLVLFTSMSLGVCAAVVSALDGKLPCCPDVASGKPSFTACCSTGDESSSSDLPVGVQTLSSPTWEIVFALAPSFSPVNPSRRCSFAEIPYRSADPQALLSTFLI